MSNHRRLRITNIAINYVLILSLLASPAFPTHRVSAAPLPVPVSQNTAASITFTKSDSLLVDQNHDGQIGPGDTLRYSLSAQNTGSVDASGIWLQDILEDNLSLVPGSMRSTPLAFGQVVQSLEDSTPIPFTLSGADLDGDFLSYTILTPPVHGLTGGTPPNLTYQPAPEYTGTDSLLFEVCDTATPANCDSAVVDFTITAVNDAPTFTPGSSLLTVLEDSGEYEMLAWAADILAGPANESTQTPHFIVTNDNNSLFAVQPAISENGTLHFTPATDQYGQASISVILQDDGGTANGGIDSSAELGFTVEVQPVNDSPSFAAGNLVTILEDSGPQTLTGWATAITPGPNEAGQTVNFRVTGNTNPDLFAVAPAVSADGTLTCQPATDRVGTAEITLVLEDDGGTANGGVDISMPHTVSITVEQYNYPPVVTPATFTIDENSVLNTPVGSITFSDPDTLQTHTFAISAGNTGDAFSIDPASGIISVAQPASIDFETTPTFNLDVTVSDNGAPVRSATAAVTIYLRDVNEAPVITPATFTIPENSLSGAAVGTVLLNDQEASQTHTYAIAAGNTGGAFTIDNLGHITVLNRAALDFETSPTFTLTVQATDNGSPAASGSAEVTVHLSNVNEAPLVSDATFTVAEYSPLNTEVGTLTVTDPELDQTHSFAIRSGNTGGSFAVDNLGRITVANSTILDFNTHPSFTLIIDVTDSGTPELSGSNTVTITVTNVNDTPVVTSTSYQLDENSPAGTALGTLSFSDLDLGQTHTFAITSGNTGGAFAINPATGVLTAAGTLDYETQPAYTLQVAVTDNGIPPATGTASIQVSLNNVNEPPVVSPASFSLPENSPTGTLAGTLTVADPETSQTHTFSIRSGNTGSAFTIDNLGRITVASQAALNFESLAAYTLEIEVTDSGAPQASTIATAAITLTDVNEAPSIANITYTLNENQANDTAVGTLGMNDPDNAQTHSFSITGGNTNGAFAIDNSGNITVANSAALNYESTTSFSLNIRVTDNGTPVLTDDATVTITLNDINEAPIVGGETYQTIGNTLLVVGAANTGPNPHIYISGSLLSNDSDPDAGNQIHAVLASSSSGAVVTITQAGEFTYLPPAGAVSDSFTYNVVDQAGLSTTGTVTIDLEGMVWYVKNDSGTSGAGRSTDPFDTLAEAQNGSAAGDTIYVYYGSGSTNGQNVGITLKANQRLIGAGVELEMPVAVNGGPNPTPLIAAGQQPWITNINASGSGVTISNGSAEIRGLNIAGSGNAIVTTYSGTTPITVSIQNNTIRAAGNEGIDINASSTGTLTTLVRNNTIGATGNGFDMLVTSGSAILDFSSNSLTSGTNGISINKTNGTLTITGFANNQISGDITGSATTISSAVFDAVPGGSIDPVNLGAYVAGTQANPVGGSGLVINTTMGNLSFTSLSVNAQAPYGLRATGVYSYTNGGLTLSINDGQGSITARSGAAISLSDLSINALNLALTSTNSSTEGARFTAVSGSLTTTNTSTISATSGTAFLVDGGSANYGYNGTINQTIGRTIQISNRSGGGVTFAGMVTGGGTGISLTNNLSTSTVTFTGGLVLNTGANAAFTASSAGTLVITGSANSLTTTTGTALSLTGTTTIGNSGMTFRSISVNGAATGINIDSIGTHGDFSVTGTSTAGSGGTIQNTSGNGIRLNNAGNISLAYMTINNTVNSNPFTWSGCGMEDASNCQAAINMVNSTNVRISRLSAGGSGQMGISGSMVNGLTLTNSTLTNMGNSNDEFAMLLTNPSGTLLIEDSTFSGMYETGIRLYKNDAAQADLTLRRVTLSSNSNTTGEDGFQFKLAGTGRANMLIDAATFTGLQRDGIDGSYQDKARLNLTVRNSLFENNAGFGGILIAGNTTAIDDDAEGFLTLDNNTIRNTVSTAIVITSATQAKLNATVTNNHIEHPAPPSIQIGEGIRLSQEENSTMTALVSNNVISGVYVRDITGYARMPAVNGSLHVTALGNTAQAPLSNPAYGIDFQVQDANHTLCLNIDNNRAWGNTAEGIRVRNLAGTFQLEGAPVGPLTTVDAASYINQHNTSVTPATAWVGSGMTFTGASTGTCRTATGATLPPVVMNQPAQLAQAGSRGTGLAKTVSSSQILDEMVQWNIGTLPEGKSITVTFDVLVADPIPDGVLQVVNQAALRGDNFAAILSDDPATAQAGDATITRLYNMPIAVDDYYTLNEDEVLTLPAPGVLSNDLAADGFTATAVLESSPARGLLSLAANGGLTYTPPPNITGDQTFTYTARDGSNHSDPAQVTIQILPVNDAPLLDPAGNMQLNPIHMGDVNNLGTLISQLLASAGSRISDVDDNALQGLAITAADTTHGEWQYTTNGGLTWNDLHLPAVTAARLLASDLNTRLRFLPAAGYFGRLDPAITFRAWDRTSGTNGGTANTSVNGGTSAYSTALETAYIDVYPMADLALHKTASVSTTLAGSQLVYTLRVINQGPGLASNVSITDPLPAGVSLVSADAGCSEVGGLVTCTQTSLDPGSSASFDLTVRIAEDITAALTNTASASTTTQESDTANNTASVTVEVANKTVVVDPNHPADPDQWNKTPVTTPDCGSTFMGEFSNETVTLSLNNLPQHTEVIVDFDLIIIRTWDGNRLDVNQPMALMEQKGTLTPADIGPDLWSLHVDGQPLIDTTFSNWDALGFHQSYPDNYPGGDYPARTGSFAKNTLCYDLDSVYHMRYTVPHTGSDLQIEFAARGLQAIADESWGLDNVSVELASGANQMPYPIYLPIIGR